MVDKVVFNLILFLVPAAVLLLVCVSFQILFRKIRNKNDAQKEYPLLLFLWYLIFQIETASHVSDFSRIGDPIKDEISKDLELAKIIQQKMLPEVLPKVKGIELSAKLIPAKQVAGDFYDCFLLRDKTLAINIGDVSGKGVPAALLASSAKYIFRFPPSLYIRPSKLMEMANKIVFMNGGGLFVSDCFATLDLSRKQLFYVNAGHPPLIHYRRKSDDYNFLPTNGALLGAAEENIYREESVFLSQGDLLLFYTDGLTEVKMKDRKVLGEEGLSSILKKWKDLPFPELQEKLISEILILYEKEEQTRDDITIVLVRVLE
jgi:sigma-B regulation protein RsbU (phosphoserine phosphatase)